MATTGIVQLLKDALESGDITAEQLRTAVAQLEPSSHVQKSIPDDDKNDETLAPPGAGQSRSRNSGALVESRRPSNLASTSEMNARQIPQDEDTTMAGSVDVQFDFGEQTGTGTGSGMGSGMGTDMLPSVDTTGGGKWSRAGDFGKAHVSVEVPAIDDDDDDDEEAHGSMAPSQYIVLDEIARGGVGAIHVVKDRDLMRTIVMKTLIDGRRADPYVVKKFMEEAQITAQLEHPNIVPVHDMGHLSGGEVFFTMKLVQGKTLKDILRGLRKEDPEMLEHYPRHRLINIFQSVCMAIAFAHSRNVLHRDIKPSNVMVGEYGEVLVLDWGVAKVLGRDDDEPAGEQVVTDRSASGDSTMMGLVTGTPSYMPPEQAAGRIDRLDQRADIYALGALLYEILTFRPPFKKKTNRETLLAVIKEKVTPPSKRTPDHVIPARLEEICLRCLRKRPHERYSEASEIIEALSEYMAGVEEQDRRIRRSDARLDDGLAIVEQFNATRAHLTELVGKLRDLEWSTPSYAPLEQKRMLWSAQDEVKVSENKVLNLFTQASAALVESIGFNNENHEACNELARLYWQRMTDAEARGDLDAARDFRHLVQVYDRGAYTELLQGEGRLSVRATPDGAEVLIQPVLESERRLRLGRERSLGVTPLANLAIAPGQWLLTIRAPGFRDLKLPTRIRHANVVDFSCHLFTDDQIGEHFLHVPAGQVQLRGDPACSSAIHSELVAVDDFFIARYPVTCAEYLAFIRDLERRVPEEALRRTPRSRLEGGQLWLRDAHGKTQIPEVDRKGYHWEAHWPVFGISFEDADAFCHWYSEKTGLKARLPTEFEWEKAARGLDGRLYSWGNQFDESFCKMAASRPGTPHPERVGSFRADCSPYGVYDMSGLVREYCDSPFDGDDATRVAKGGSYLTSSGLSCRVTYRQGVHRRVPALDHGFRLVRSPETQQEAGARRIVRPQF